MKCDEIVYFSFPYKTIFVWATKYVGNFPQLFLMKDFSIVET